MLSAQLYALATKSAQMVAPVITSKGSKFEISNLSTDFWSKVQIWLVSTRTMLRWKWPIYGCLCRRYENAICSMYWCLSAFRYRVSENLLERSYWKYWKVFVYRGLKLKKICLIDYQRSNFQLVTESCATGCLDCEHWQCHLNEVWVLSFWQRCHFHCQNQPSDPNVHDDIHMLLLNPNNPDNSPQTGKLKFSFVDIDLGVTESMKEVTLTGSGDEINDFITNPKFACSFVHHVSFYITRNL